MGEKMLILITYDVNTETSAGRSRLRKVAKQCVNYGQRVQNSVFECQVDAVKYREIKAALEKIVDKDTDSLRFYNLGDKYKNKVEHIGTKPSFDVTEPIDFLTASEHVSNGARILSTQKSLRHSHQKMEMF